jgi:hypothetical protein
MKALIIAATLLAAGATAASAQRGPDFGRDRDRVPDRRPGVSITIGQLPPPPVWRRDFHPYDQRRHSVCQEKSRRLYIFERRAEADGRLSFWERRTVSDLQRDLDRTCGRFRYRD